MSAATPPLLPLPHTVRPRPGVFRLGPDLALAAPNEEWAAVARRLLAPGTGLPLPSRSDGVVRLHRDPALPSEAYRLSVDEHGVDITAADLAGVNWATQTLRQLLPPAALRAAPDGTELTATAIEVQDEPRFGWRGLMLDVARHFTPFADLLVLIDLLALHKYNVLQLHLTDDQGWRFESRRHPLLTERGSWRAETRWPPSCNEGGAATSDGTPHGGYYTQEQLRTLVRYAADRGVTVVPEVDMPGHVLAALAAYPQLGNHPDRRYAAATTFGVFDEVLSLDEKCMEFVLDLYDELLSVFPTPFVHVGGDECRRTEWLASASAGRLAAERGLSGPEQLQRWFTETLRDWLATRGRRLVGWDEINDDGPLSGAVTMAWRDASYGAAAAAAGSEVVMAPMRPTYFDFYSSDDPDEPYAIGGLNRTEDVYAFDPEAAVAQEHRHRVLGTCCQLWTEYVPTFRHAQYALFPRACAHSEVAWSRPDGRSLAEFRPRLAGHLARLDALGVNYRPEAGPLAWQVGGTGRWRRRPSTAA